MKKVISLGTRTGLSFPLEPAFIAYPRALLAVAHPFVAVAALLLVSGVGEVRLAPAAISGGVELRSCIVSVVVEERVARNAVLHTVAS
eukprot:scaffold36711_cov66-Phaeocystis_antarctica.AAC.2